MVKKAPVKTYGSKNKDSAAVAKTAAERTTDKGDKSRSTDGQDEQSSRKAASKRRKVVGSDSELSDTAPPAAARKASKTSGKDAQKDTAETSVNAKRTAKKRAIIASDDETEDEELHTPDSKRRKPDGARPTLSKSIRPRDSSVDPLDMDVDNGISGKSGRMEVSIEMSPASVIDLQSSLRAPGDATSKAKSPNKVHFEDPPAEEEEPVAKPAPKAKKAKSVSRTDDAYDEPPEFAPPVEDDDEEDGFVPSGSKKAKAAKAKAAKAKKATAAKEKTAKGKKATQAKGKKGKVADVVVEPVEAVQWPPEEPAVKASEGPIASVEKENSTIATPTASIAKVPEVTETAPAASGKGKAKRIVVVGKKAPKSAETIEDDEPTTPKASADVVAEKEPIPVPVPEEPEAAIEDAPIAATARATQGKKAAAKNKVVESDVESEKEVEKETTPPVAVESSAVSCHVEIPVGTKAHETPLSVREQSSPAQGVCGR